MQVSVRKFLLSSIISLTTAQASAGPVCSLIMSEPVKRGIVIEDPVQQWLIWEQKSNFKIFRKSEEPVKASIVQVPADSVEVTLLPSAPKSLQQIIFQGSSVNWFRHPYNKKKDIPHFDKPSKQALVTYLTASRSLAVRIGDDIFTLKMPTDYPHGPEGQHQPGKATTKEDILDGINRMKYVDKVDAKIGTDPDLILAKEVAMVADKKTGEGYLFRDLSFLKDGYYYLPALSIPYAGRDIAAYHKQDPDLFWMQHYAEVLGRAKAKLLLRYGLQMETPNSQNMLIQLDQNLYPTGRIVFRDISDTFLIEGVAKALGEIETLIKDSELGVENSKNIKPFFENSFWRFDEAGEDSFSPKMLRKWGNAHDFAYINEIQKVLKVSMEFHKKYYIDGNRNFSIFVSSPLGRARLRQYREKLMREHQEKLSQAKAG